MAPGREINRGKKRREESGEREREREREREGGGGSRGGGEGGDGGREGGTEGGREGERGRERKREKERERACVCVHALCIILSDQSERAWLEAEMEKIVKQKQALEVLKKVLLLFWP